MKSAIQTLATLAAVLMASQPVSAYMLDMSAGVFPPGVTVSNETGVNPATAGYKRGYTRDGWVIDRYGTYGYVAVSPTFTEKNEACRNVMTLPAIGIEEGYYLSWHGVSVHPDRKEKYSVIATVEGSGTSDTLFATDSESDEWTAHLVNLNAYAGKKVTISFVCESTNRYMLAIGGVTVDVPKGVSFEVRDRSEVYSDAYRSRRSRPYVIDIMNTGATLTEGEIRLDANYEPTPRKQWRAHGFRERHVHSRLTLP